MPNPQRLTDRRALLSGSGHGIGRACALRLATEGARLVLLDLDLAAAERVAEEVRAGGGEASAVHCDVTDTGSVEAAVAEAVGRLGGLDVLVSTAGGGVVEADFTESRDDDWLQQVDLNLMSVVRVTRACLPALREARGCVVSTSSVNALGALGSEAYSAAKAGLHNLTQNLAAQNGPYGVRVNLVVPGTIRTRVWDGREDVVERLSQRYPLRRVGEPADVAAAVAFLASDDAAWVSGVALPVDGGLLAASLGHLFEGEQA